MTQAVLVAHSYLTKTVEVIFDFFKSIGEARQKRKIARQTFKELSALNDKDLADIGISRGDIWHIANSENPNLKGWV